jgi:ATP-dependent exoDNAse (exonuclease V) beta subunit
MESHVVVLTDVDTLATARDRRKAYVGMTRAKYDLFVLGQPEALAVITG